MTQTIIFNSTEKTVKVYDGPREESNLIFYYLNVPTVKVKEEGFYEVIQRETNSEGMEANYPVARFSIANSTMLIER